MIFSPAVAWNLYTFLWENRGAMSIVSYGSQSWHPGDIQIPSFQGRSSPPKDDNAVNSIEPPFCKNMLEKSWQSPLMAGRSPVVLDDGRDFSAADFSAKITTSEKNTNYPCIQWEISRILKWRYVSTIFSAIWIVVIFPWNLGLKNRPYIWNRYLQSIGSWNGHWCIAHYSPSISYYILMKCRSICFPSNQCLAAAKHWLDPRFFFSALQDLCVSQLGGSLWRFRADITSPVGWRGDRNRLFFWTWGWPESFTRLWFMIWLWINTY